MYDFRLTDRGTFYYVMELLDGRDRESRFEEVGPLPPERAIHLLSQVCRSLAEARAKGLIHRDIKPANIDICRMGLEYDDVKLAPEAILGDAGIDDRLDIYAVGCVAYYLLTGGLVFAAQGSGIGDR